MLQGNAAECPQRVLQAFGERHEALSAQHDMRVFEARVSEPKVIEAVGQRGAGDRDGEFHHIGEVR